MNLRMKKHVAFITLFLSCAFALAGARKFLVIDVRSPQEFKSDHVEGALNIPYRRIGKQIAKHETDKARNIAVYCASGARSGVTRETLFNAGYTNVINGGSVNQMRAILKNNDEK